MQLGIFQKWNCETQMLQLVVSNMFVVWSFSWAIYDRFWYVHVLVLLESFTDIRVEFWNLFASKRFNSFGWTQRFGMTQQVPKVDFVNGRIHVILKVKPRRNLPGIDTKNGYDVFKAEVFPPTFHYWPIDYWGRHSEKILDADDINMRISRFSTKDAILFFQI